MYASRLPSAARVALFMALVSLPSVGCDALFAQGDDASSGDAGDTWAGADGWESPDGGGTDGSAGSCAVVSVDPRDGQTAASNDVTVTVRFSQPLATLPGGQAPPVTLARLAQDGSVAEVLAPNTSWRAEGSEGVLFMTPVGWLAWDTEYQVTVGAATTCADGTTVGADVVSRFRTPPQAGAQAAGGVFYACRDTGGRLSLRRVGLDGAAPGAADAEVADLGAVFPGGAPGVVVSGVPSPDGGRVVWGVVGSDQFTSALVGYDLTSHSAYLLSADAVFTADDALAQTFDISPAGQVAFLGPLHGGQRDQITVVGLDGAGARTVLGPATVMDSLAGVAWTADGARLIVLAAGGAHPGIYEVDAATGDETLRQNLNQQTILGLPGYLAYDAASGHAALSFTKNFGAQNENSELLAWANLGQGPVFSSASGAVNEGAPVLTPGGGRLVFTQYSATTQVASVAAYSFSDGAVVPLLMSGGAVQRHSFTPDGETVVYTDSDGQGGTMLLARTGSEAPRTLAQTSGAQCDPGLAVVVP